MNAKEMKAQKNGSERKHLPGYCKWYRAILAIMFAFMAVYLVGIVGWFTGHTLNLFYGIEGLLFEHAMETPGLILHMDIYGIVCFAVMAIITGLAIMSSIREKEYSFDRFRQLMIVVLFSFWTVPLYHAVADLALTAFDYRSMLAFDVFALGLNIWPTMAVTVISIVLLVVNGKLGEIPTGEEIY